MPTQAEIEAATRAYLDFEPKEGEEIWSRVESAMRAALDAAERIRMLEEQELKRLDNLIARRLYWQLPIIAMRARLAAEAVLRAAKIDPADLKKPMDI